MEWKPRLRWFAAQFVIIVAGVLTALAVDSWHSRRAVRDSERFYISQLLRELQSAEQTLHRSSTNNEKTAEAAAALMAAFRHPGNAAIDSIRPLVAMLGWISTPYIDFSVAQGLVSGNLSTIRSDSLRAELLTLLSRAESFRQIQAQVSRAYLGYVDRLREKAPLAERLATMSQLDSSRLQEYPALPFAADRSTAFPTDYVAFLRDREAFVIVDGLFDWGSDLAMVQRRLAAEVGRVRHFLERVELQ